MNSDILEQIYKLYSQQLYLYIYSLCRNTALAEDLLQETFLKAILSLPDSNKNVRAWLYMVARNLYFDRLKYEKHISREADMKQLKDLSSNQPLDRIIKDEQNKLLYQALNVLDDRKREILELQYFGGLSQQEIAQIMHLKPNNIRVLALRARREIRLWMEENGYDLP